MLVNTWIQIHTQDDKVSSHFATRKGTKEDDVANYNLLLVRMHE